MDTVREEVMALMQEGMQKTASFCASLCAERIVAARRDMQRRFEEERRELERLVGTADKQNAAPTSPTVPVGFPTHSPPKPDAHASALPPTRTLPLVYQPDASPGSVKTIRTGPAAGSWTGPSMGPLMALTACAQTPLPAEPRAAGSTVAGAAPLSGVSFGGASNVNGTVGVESYDASFIDAYDAVQTLEERTSMAARAMDLLDEALQAAAEATSSRPQSARSSRISPAGPVFKASQQPQAASPDFSTSPPFRAEDGGDSAPLMESSSPVDGNAHVPARPSVVLDGDDSCLHGLAYASELEITQDGQTGLNSDEAGSIRVSMSTSVAQEVPLENEVVDAEHRSSRGVVQHEPSADLRPGRASIRECSVASSANGSIAAVDLHGA